MVSAQASSKRLAITLYVTLPVEGPMSEISLINVCMYYVLAIIVLNCGMCLKNKPAVRKNIRGLSAVSYI